MSDEAPSVIRGMLDQPFSDPFRAESEPEPENHWEAVIEDAKIRETQKHRWAHGALVAAVAAVAWHTAAEAWGSARHGDAWWFEVYMLGLLLDGAAIMVNVAAMKDA